MTRNKTVWVIAVFVLAVAVFAAGPYVMGSPLSYLACIVLIGVGVVLWASLDHPRKTHPPRR